MKAWGGLAVITLVTAVPVSLILPLPALIMIALTSLLAGLAASFALERGRRKETEGLLAGFALGTVCKALALGTAALLGWSLGASVPASVIFALALVLGYSVWTLYCFAVLSAAGF